MFHYRDATGLEVDVVAGTPQSVLLTEAESGATVASDFTVAVERLAAEFTKRNPSHAVTTRVVYGGVMRQSRGPTAIIPWHSIDREQWHGDIVGS